MFRVQYTFTLGSGSLLTDGVYVCYEGGETYTRRQEASKEYLEGPYDTSLLSDYTYSAASAQTTRTSGHRSNHIVPLTTGWMQQGSFQTRMTAGMTYIRS